MIKSGIEQAAPIDMFAGAPAKQGAKLRKAVADATLKALQGLGPLGLQVAPGLLQGVGRVEEEDLGPRRQLQKGLRSPLLPASSEEDVGVQEEAVEPNGRGRQGGRAPPR